MVFGLIQGSWMFWMNRWLHRDLSQARGDEPLVRRLSAEPKLDSSKAGMLNTEAGVACKAMWVCI